MTKILVIEDEELIRENILELLEAENFETIGAENGRIGVQLALSQIPDLILCDIMMPELDGYEVLASLRQDQMTAAIPLIFLTAKAAKADFRQGMEMGADDYLTKPFTRAELLGAISTRLSKQATTRKRYTAALRQAAERLNHLAYYDSLTGLPNRSLLRERLQQALTQANRKQELLPVLSLNLDRFSRINETLGQSWGDVLLKAVAERLTASVGEGNTVARLNADQFIIVLATVNCRQEAADIAQVILDDLSHTFILNDQEVFVTASIGLAFCPPNGNKIDTLIQRAEAAMYYVKGQGGNGYQFYNVTMRTSSSDHLVLETGLHWALSRSEFQVYYQPQVDILSGKIVGAEALVRWQHAERGLVSPAEFIPLAETTGLIIPIGEWVLRTACEQTRIWHKAGFPQLRVAVNLSARQFNQPRLSQKIVQVLEATGLEPHSLELEVTESILMQDVTNAIATLNDLRSQGIEIAIDDFGTGYSSLSYLRRFPFNTLKIDRCFVRNLTLDSTNTAITTAVIQMAHSLKLKVVAEGVETESELAFLYQQQCEAMQGFLFSHPLPAQEFEHLLTTDKRLPIVVSR